MPHIKFAKFQHPLAATFLLLICAGNITVVGQEKTGRTQTPSPRDDTQDRSGKAAIKYNEKLAKRLGADDYGMKNYVLVILVTGKKKIEDAAERNKIFRGHFQNMERLADNGKLVLAGPFVDAEPKRGLFILNVATLEDAEALVKTDPAVKAGVFDYELSRLYSSAALMQINNIHKRLQKKTIE